MTTEYIQLSLFSPPAPKWPGRLVARRCQHCGIPYLVLVAKVRTRDSRYCSPACHNASRRSTRIACVCAECGAVFYQIPFVVRQGAAIHCSVQCRDRARDATVSLVCANCGMTFQVAGTQARRGRRFCSKKCAGEAKRGAAHPLYRGHDVRARTRAMGRRDYKIWRRAVIERDEHTCQRCGRQGTLLHAHHIKPWEEHPDVRYDVNNGVTLCPSCHRHMHHTCS
jgi:hypothetical protein